MIGIIQLKDWARLIKRDTLAVYFAAKDCRTSALLRLLAIAIAAYAFSPIDLIPDFIPVLGYLDDLLIVPAGLYIAIRLLPPEVLSDARAKASAVTINPTSRKADIAVVFIWILSTVTISYWWFST